jgi:broad specificity phosphatase PhoE
MSQKRLKNYPDVALRVHSFLGILTRETAGESVLVVWHSVVVLIFRKLLERLSEQATAGVRRGQELRNLLILSLSRDR